MDVFTSEPPKEHLHALLRHPNVVCTPHLGASTEEAQINVARDIAIQMCDVLDQKDVSGHEQEASECVALILLGG